MKTETELREEYRALQHDLRSAMLDFISTPSATNYAHLTGAMLDYQGVYQSILDAREKTL